MKVNNEMKVTIANGVMEKLDDLAAKRNKWQVQYDRTNHTLYELLAGCLDSYYAIKGTKAEKVFLENIKESLKARKLKVQEGTSVLNLIVRYVFDSDRRRIFGYARVLRVAVKDSIEVANFVEWVKKAGGLEEITSSKGATEETIKKRLALEAKVEDVKDLLVEQLQHPLAVVPKTHLVSAVDTAEYTLLIGKMQVDGKTKVLSVVPDASSAMIQTAIKKIAEALIAHVERVTKERLEKEADSAKLDALNSAELLEAA